MRLLSGFLGVGVLSIGICSPAFSTRIPCEKLLYLIGLHPISYKETFKSEGFSIANEVQNEGENYALDLNFVQQLHEVKGEGYRITGMVSDRKGNKVTVNEWIRADQLPSRWAPLLETNNEGKKGKSDSTHLVVSEDTGAVLVVAKSANHYRMAYLRPYLLSDKQLYLGMDLKELEDGSFKVEIQQNLEKPPSSLKWQVDSFKKLVTPERAEGVNNHQGSYGDETNQFQNNYQISDKILSDTLTELVNRYPMLTRTMGSELLKLGYHYCFVKSEKFKDQMTQLKKEMAHRFKSADDVKSLMEKSFDWTVEEGTPAYAFRDAVSAFKLFDKYNIREGLALRQQLIDSLVSGGGK